MMNSGRPVNQDPRRHLPSVDKLALMVRELAPELPEWARLMASRDLVTTARAQWEPESPRGIESIEHFAKRALARARALAAPSPGRLINATGVVLHTNLGRAPLAPGAAEAAARAAMGYSDLEFDLETGRRGQRLRVLDMKLSQLGGSEAAFACNNNAGAVMLALNTLAAGREVIVSRGELVEIGGSFRVPEIMQRANVRLVEVGSTNRTHLRDYAQAIGPETALLLKVHRSNFTQTGFIKEVSLGELVSLGAESGVPVMEDLGSGTLVDLARHGFPDESYVPGRVAQGADLVCFSGDKLMGGPQAGLVLGGRETVAALRSNPLARALRLDAMTLAALDWTLTAMLDGRAEADLPLLAQLLEPIDQLEARTERFVEQLESELRDRGGAVPDMVITRDRAPVGGGTLPSFELETAVLEVRSKAPAQDVAAFLRAVAVPVIVRIRDEKLLIDLRTVASDEVAELLDALASGLAPRPEAP